MEGGCAPNTHRGFESLFYRRTVKQSNRRETMTQQEIVRKYESNENELRRLRVENLSLLKELEAYAPHKRGEIVTWTESHMGKYIPPKGFSKKIIEKKGVIVKVKPHIYGENEVRFSYDFKAFKKDTNELSQMHSYPSNDKITYTGEYFKLPEKC